MNSTISTGNTPSPPNSQRSLRACPLAFVFSRRLLSNYDVEPQQTSRNTSQETLPEPSGSCSLKSPYPNVERCTGPPRPRSLQPLSFCSIPSSPCPWEPRLSLRQSPMTDRLSLSHRADTSMPAGASVSRTNAWVHYRKLSTTCDSHGISHDFVMNLRKFCPSLILACSVVNFETFSMKSSFTVRQAPHCLQRVELKAFRSPFCVPLRCWNERWSGN